MLSNYYTPSPHDKQYYCPKGNPLLLSKGVGNVKTRRVIMALLLTFTLFQSLIVVSGCTSVRQKFDDGKRYFLTEVVRW